MSIPIDVNAPLCDTCGAPATSAAIDILHEPDYRTGLMGYAPVGRPKYGCDRHPAESKDHYSDPGPLA